VINTDTEVALDLIVTRRRDEASGVVSLELRRTDGAPMPPWSPGAHVELEPEPNLRRQYSICSAPEDADAWRIAVLNEANGRGGSRLIHEQVFEGHKVTAHGPRNHFPLVSATKYLFIAGGIGITPIIPMLAQADAAGADWELVYGGRSLESMAFHRDLVARYGDRVHVRPETEYGLLDLDGLLGTPLPGTLVYCCGPEALLSAVEDRCASWPPRSLHLERFAPKDLGEPVLASTFEVELKRTGITVAVPSGKSVLEVLEEAGVEVAYSCREGVCGTCETGVLDGIVDHRDSILLPEEQEAQDAMMICVSRADCPRLVLDR
jgi:ferredoxin-NADP reductase